MLATVAANAKGVESTVAMNVVEIVVESVVVMLCWLLFEIVVVSVSGCVCGRGG